MSSLRTDKNVLLLGGAENAVSVVRSLGRKGIRVFVSSSRYCTASYSRFGIDKVGMVVQGDDELHWRKLLIDEPDTELQGAIILALSDSAISFIAKFEDQLKGRYILESNQADVRARLLDKLETIHIAEKAELGAPKSFEVKRGDNIEVTTGKVRYPILVKPIYSHLFREQFGVKVILVNSQDEASDVIRRAHEHSLDVMLCEWIPGPDSQICSYYAYIDAAGRPLVEFTKFVTRRHPQYFGGAVFHGTSWQPDVAEAGRRFFASLGMIGICNIEFKRDPRDGSLIVIESNPRVTAAQELLVRCGLDLAEITYRDLTDQHIEVKSGTDYSYGRTFWYPRQDFAAFRGLLAKNEVTWREWLGQISRLHVFPYFRLDDPLPTIVRMKRFARELIGRASRRDDFY